MRILSALGQRTKRLVLPVLCAGVIVYCGYHVLQGDRGLRAGRALDRAIAEAETTAKRLAAERVRWEHRVSLLSAKAVDPDMVEERARLMLNRAHPDEIIVLIRPR